MARRRRRRLASRVRHYVRQLLAFLFSNVGVVVLLCGYTIAGAFIFQAIEGASEMQRINDMARERDSTANYLWQNITLTLNLFNETELKLRISSELHLYQRKVVVAVRRGWDGGRSSRHWSFSSAFLYSLTVITTIGYGNLSPRTTWGKLATIFYALLGMPLFLLYLSNVGELLARWFKCMYALLCLCRGCPGFTRRRVVRLQTQVVEISEAESIERPEHWKNDSEGRSEIGPVHRQSQDHDFYQRTQNYNRSYSTPHPSAVKENPDFRPPWDRQQSEYQRPHPRDFRFEHVIPRRAHPGSLNPYARDRDFSPGRADLRGYRYYHRGPDLDLRDPRYEVINPRDPRGYSQPGYGSETSVAYSDFTYVTFDAQTITVPISVCVFILVGYIIFGSMIFGLWEKWDQLDGAYFCFISLSSIGFGDFVPGERVMTQKIEPSFIVCSMYLMLGMALVAMCFNLMQEQVIHYFAGIKRALKRICRCKR